eukprot:1193739-Prorocentrum_minimum.AAC.4
MSAVSDRFQLVCLSRSRGGRSRACIFRKGIEFSRAVRACRIPPPTRCLPRPGRRPYCLPPDACPPPPPCLRALRPVRRCPLEAHSSEFGSTQTNDIRKESTGGCNSQVTRWLDKVLTVNATVSASRPTLHQHRRFPSALKSKNRLCQRLTRQGASRGVGTQGVGTPPACDAPQWPPQMTDVGSLALTNDGQWVTRPRE